MADERKLRPGDIAPKPGLYAVVDADGRTTDVVYQIRKSGTVLPPTYRKRQWFVMLNCRPG